MISTLLTKSAKDQSRCVVEAYFLPGPAGAAGSDVTRGTTGCIGWPDSVAACVVEAMGSEASVQRLVEYQHRDLTYSYDLASDAQRAYRRTVINESNGTTVDAILYDEETLPSHLYPCLNEVTDRRTIHRLTWRVNNRMYLVVDLEKEQDNKIASYVYIRYQHADNVDTKRIDQDYQVLADRIGRHLQKLSS